MPGMLYSNMETYRFIADEQQPLTDDVPQLSMLVAGLHTAMQKTALTYQEMMVAFRSDHERSLELREQMIDGMRMVEPPDAAEFFRGGGFDRLYVVKELPESRIGGVTLRLALRETEVSAPPLNDGFIGKPAKAKVQFSEVLPDGKKFSYRDGSVRNGWEKHGACMKGDPDANFPGVGQNNAEGLAPVLAVCMSCVVRGDCLTDALNKDEDFGVRGGMSERARKAMRKRMVKAGIVFPGKIKTGDYIKDRKSAVDAEPDVEVTENEPDDE